MIAGLELPTSGEIYIDGQKVGLKPASQRDIAFVFQMFALYPHMKMRQNIAYPLVSQGMPRGQVRAKVAEVAQILEIEAILDRPVSGLSGGDRQRVALGRAIVRNPKCFLMDEPLGALVAKFRERMGLARMHGVGGAQPGDRTMIDALQLALDNLPRGLPEATRAARAGPTGPPVAPRWWMVPFCFCSTRRPT